MARFEKVSKYKDEDVRIPVRATKDSAGYDIAAAEDIIIQPYAQLMQRFEALKIAACAQNGLTVDEIANLTKTFCIRPTLVPTGIKCKLDEGTYLKVVTRSSCPLKSWLVLANSEAIIDKDYYNNSSNEGEVFLQFINFSTVPIIIHKGDLLAQGIITPYLTTEDDNADGVRTGGFGSTDETPST